MAGETACGQKHRCKNDWNEMQKGGSSIALAQFQADDQETQVR
jgi:hypothetical protein